MTTCTGSRYIKMHGKAVASDYRSQYATASMAVLLATAAASFTCGTWVGLANYTPNFARSRYSFEFSR
jgi:hypothetical protein